MTMVTLLDGFPEIDSFDPNARTKTLYFVPGIRFVAFIGENPENF